MKRISPEKLAEIEKRIANTPDYGLQQAVDVGALIIEIEHLRFDLAEAKKEQGENLPFDNRPTAVQALDVVSRHVSNCCNSRPELVRVVDAARAAIAAACKAVCTSDPMAHQELNVALNRLGALVTQIDRSPHAPRIK